jgi:uncharacterized protein (TIGR03382 family)
MVAVVLAVAQMAMAVPTPLAEYRFEETGTTAINTGSLGAVANLSMGSTLADPSDRHSPPGDGVHSSTPIALDHRFGDDSVGARAVSSSSVSGLDNLAGLTVTGWYLSERGDGLVGNERRLVANHDGGLGFVVEGGAIAGNQSMLRLTVRSGNVVSGIGTYPGSAQYTYFAVTFDGTSGANNVQFYRGDTGLTPAALVATQTLLFADTGDNGNSMAVGGNAGLNAPRTFHGLLDDVRIFGSVLSAGDIEAVRLSSLPEPATPMVAMFVLVGAALHRRRRIAAR